MKCIDCAMFEEAGYCPHCGKPIYICADGFGVIGEIDNEDNCDGVWED